MNKEGESNNNKDKTERLGKNKSFIWYVEVTKSQIEPRQFYFVASNGNAKKLQFLLCLNSGLLFILIDC